MENVFNFFAVFFMNVIMKISKSYTKIQIFKDEKINLHSL